MCEYALIDDGADIFGISDSLKLMYLIFTIISTQYTLAFGISTSMINNGRWMGRDEQIKYTLQFDFETMQTMNEEISIFN